MGCGGTKVHVIRGDHFVNYDPEFDTGLDLHVNLPAKFAELDADGSGEIDYEEFCAGFGFTATKLTRKLFDAFDQDEGGTISIVEFVAGLRNWDNFKQNDKMKFTYKAECLADTNGAWKSDESLSRVIRKIMKHLRDSEIHRLKLKDFVALAKKYPSVLFLPLFGLMEKIFDVVEFSERSANSRGPKKERRRGR